MRIQAVFCCADLSVNYHISLKKKAFGFVSPKLPRGALRFKMAATFAKRCILILEESSYYLFIFAGKGTISMIVIFQFVSKKSHISNFGETDEGS